MCQNIIKIQKIFRGYNSRKLNINLKDDFTFDILIKCIDNFNKQIIFVNEINSNLSKKKIRKNNFPSYISENIIKFFFRKKYNICPNWYTDKGDLTTEKCKCKFIRIEVKGSINLENGPSSFGPKEHWDIIYFVDGKNISLKKIKIYEIKLSNKNEIWKNIKINKNETYHDQCLQKRRPRINFNKIKNQIKEHCKLVFDDFIEKLR